MRKTELYLFIAILVMLLILISDLRAPNFNLMKNLLVLFLILAFHFYEKSLPHKDKLNIKLKRIFNYCDKFFTPVLKTINAIVKPINVGINLQFSLGSSILILLLLLIMIF
jgi:hypothetical protein